MKKLLAVLLAATMAMSLAACAAKPAEEAAPAATEAAAEVKEAATEAAEEAAAEVAEAGAKKVGLLQINNTNSYYIGASEAFHKMAGIYGYELDEQFCENSIELEISKIENMIELGYDAIIFDPQDAEALEDIVAKGQEAGVKMVAMRGLVDGCNYIWNIPHHDAFYGAVIAGCEALGGEGKVLLLEGQIGHEASDERTRAFYEVMELYPNIEVLDDQPCDWDPNKAVDVVDSWITAYGDEISAIFCETDGATPAVVNAVANAGLTDKVLVIGNDGEVECLEYMKEGTVLSEAYWGSQRDGAMVSAYVDAILRGVDVPSTVWIPVYAVCAPELQEKVVAKWADANVCTAQEALDMSAQYDKEFIGYFD